MGTSPQYLEVMGLELYEGRWLSDVDLERRENVTVLGASAAEAQSTFLHSILLWDWPSLYWLSPPIPLQIRPVNSRSRSFANASP